MENDLMVNSNKLNEKLYAIGLSVILYWQGQKK